RADPNRLTVTIVRAVPLDLSRRAFIQVALTATGGLLASCDLQVGESSVEAGDAVALGAFVQIHPSGEITIGARGCELGQGVKTSLPMLIAEELDADWARVRVVALPFEMETRWLPRPRSLPRYGSQSSSASMSIRKGWDELRQVGAQVRWRLVEAAARRWHVPAEEIRTEAGTLIAPDGATASYGELAADAAQIDPPAAPLPLKSPSDFRIIGQPQRTVDARELVTGAAKFGLDSREPGALVAVIARCPYFGGAVARVDAARARQIPGVRHVIELPLPARGPSDSQLAAGVAVVADDTWTALRGRDALEIEWTQGPNSGDTTAALEERCRAALRGEAIVVRADGDVAKALARAARVVEAEYVVPFAAHATLEPQNAFVDLSRARDRALVRAPTQRPARVLKAIQDATGARARDVEVQLPRAGGGFGRRLEGDAVAEAVRIAQRIGALVQVVWTREDDLQNDFYRPFAVHALRAGLDAEGLITAWSQRTAGTPLRWSGVPANDAPIWRAVVDPEPPIARLVPSFRSEFNAVEFPLARGWWRAPGHTSAVFASESFLDELAHAGGRDPLELRLALVSDARAPEGAGRFAQVLRLAAERIGWGRAALPGRGVGIAAYALFGGYIAHALDVSLESGALRIHRCVCAVDVGQVVNPLGLEAQLIGGTLDGVSAALHQEITVKDGRIEQANFDTYRLLTMREAPDVEVAIVPSTLAPAGAGELATPTAAPALANAIFAATGKRLRRMPFAPQLRA
ncbi:MAG TPA: molybdopterin cofactor-binding domain-containing protein, partial [Myxococcota bacterium]|nr:molybdopterin cofactor-binding domain-containing protein [Myxococcota bacterium]